MGIKKLNEVGSESAPPRTPRDSRGDVKEIAPVQTIVDDEEVSDDFGTPCEYRNEQEAQSVEPEIKLAPVYRVHAEVGTNPSMMSVRVLTVDTAASPALIRPDVIPEACRHRVTKCRPLVIRSATNHKARITESIELFVRIGDACIPYIFGVVPHLPPGILEGTALIDGHIQCINPAKRLIEPKHSKPVLILSYGEEEVSEIQIPSALDPFDSSQIFKPLRVAKRTIISPGTQQLVTVDAQVDGLVSIVANSHLFQRHR